MHTQEGFSKGCVMGVCGEGEILLARMRCQNRKSQKDAWLKRPGNSIEQHGLHIVTRALEDQKL